MKRLLSFLLGASVLFIFGCNTTPDPVLTVSPENLAFSAEGGVQTVQVKANNPWTASATGAGISINPSSGEGDATVTVTATATNSPFPITGTISFRSEGLSASVSITQEERKVIQLGDVMTIPAEGGSFAIDVKYNTDVVVEVESEAQSWIRFVAVRALKSGKLEFGFAENGSTDPRQGKVTVKDKNGKVSPITLTFVQEEKKVIAVGDVMEIPAEGGAFAVDIQYNTEYTVEVEASAKSWISFLGTRALQSGKLEFQFAENQNTEPRTGKVTVRDNSGKAAPVTLNFVQEEKKVITVGDVMTIPAEGGTFAVDIQYNTDFDVVVESGAQSWITFVATRALKSGKLEFRFAENQSTDPRQGKVTVKDKNGKVSDITLTFVQEEKKVIQHRLRRGRGVRGTVLDYLRGHTCPAERQAGIPVRREPEHRSASGKGDRKRQVWKGVRHHADLRPGREESHRSRGRNGDPGGGRNLLRGCPESAAQSWIHFVAVRALTSGKLEFSFDANPNPDARTGKVTVKDKNGKVSPITLNFVQADKKVIAVGDVMEIPAEGGTFSVDVQYNTDVVVEVESAAQSWIHFVAVRALTSGKLEFSFDANPNPDVRTGKVTVKDKNGKVSPITLTFVQEEKKVISVGDVMEIPAEGGTFSVDVQYNTDVVVEVESAAQSWIHFVAVRALTSGKLEFSFDANDGPQRTGKVTIRSSINSIEPTELIFTQLQDEKLLSAQRVMTDLYEALGARNWNDPWIPGVTWPGFSYNRENGTASIVIDDMGAKGTIPESIGDLGDLLVSLVIQNETGISGTLPDSFRKLVNLKEIYIRNTSMTSLPDLFADMKELESISVLLNSKMTGSLPESLHNCTKLQVAHFGSNMFTGNVPSSWSQFSDFCFVFENCLSGKLSVFCHTPAEIKSFVANGNLWQREGYGFDISDVEIPRHSMQPEGSINDLNGNPFTFEDVISRNKYTVYLIWDTWSPFSLSMMQEVKEYYEEYHKDGLEIIATVMLGPDGPWNDLEEQKRVVADNGYGLWYNFYWPAVSSSFLSHTPAAEVYDSKGNILFSGFTKYLDPVRNRFARNASEDLVPFLETLFGPMHTYTSTDYSKDGEVTVLQSASVGKGVNIVFMGDAYTDKDMADGGRYDKTMREAMEEFFAIEPYKTFRNRFNVYEVKAVSPNGKVGNRYTTALSCYYGGGTTILGDHDKCFEYALKVPGIVNQDNLLINVMVNSERSIGTTFMSYMRQSCVSFTTTALDNRQFYGPVLRHEAGGHGLAFLADEYANYSGTPPTDHVSTYNSRFENYGWYSNIDFTNDRSKIRWKAFLSDSRYNGQVGIFEGAALYEQGAYRSTEKSIMRYLDESDEFNAPSRWKIYQQIMDRSGEECSFEKFLEYDAVNRAKASQAAARPPLKAAAKVQTHRQTAPPVIIK